MKKAISPVVAMALLIVIVVIGVIGFQLWTEAFQSTQSTLADKQAAKLPYTFKIDSIRGDQMYVYSSNNQTFSNVSIAGVACNITTNLSIGMNILNISSCVQAGVVNDVLYVLDQDEFGARSIYPKVAVSVSGTTFTITYWTNISDYTSNDEYIHSINIDNNDNFYLVGYCQSCGDVGGHAMLLEKYNSTGHFQWRNITDPTSNNNEELYEADFDSNNNIYVAGRCEGCGSNGGRAIYTMSFDTNGNHRWTNITDPTSNNDGALGITLDSNDNIYVLAWCIGCGSIGGYSGYIIKYNSTFDLQWVNATDYNSNGDVHYTGKTDSSGNLYTIGYCQSCGNGSYGIIVQKFNDLGHLQWETAMDPSSGDDFGFEITLDTNNNIYTAGYCEGCGSLGDRAIHLSSFDSDGIHRWTNITDVTANDDHAYGITSDSSDNIYIAGSCLNCGSTGSYAMYLASFNSNGVLRWSNITDVTALQDEARDIVLTNSQNTIITGGRCESCGPNGGRAQYFFNRNSATGGVD